MVLEQIVDKITLLSDQFEEREIVIFGTGKGGRLTLFALQTLGYRPSCFIDNNEDVLGHNICAIPVHSPDYLREQSQPKIILIASMYFIEIYEQLMKMNISQESIYSVLDHGNEDKDDRGDYKSTRIINGIKVGRYTYGYENISHPHIMKEIGSFCSINHTAQVAGNHPVSYISTSPVFYTKKERDIGNEIIGFIDDQNIQKIFEVTNYGPITIGHDVWIGANAIILPSVKIGNGAIIAAGAVVNRDVPDYAIVGGVPAKLIRFRFSQEEIIKLNKIQWWNWPEEEINSKAKDFFNNKRFFEQYTNGEMV